MILRRRRKVTESEKAVVSAAQFEKEIPGFARAYQDLKAYMSLYVHKLQKQVLGGPFFLYAQAGDVVAHTPRIIVLFAFNRKEVHIDSVRCEQVEERDPFSLLN